MGDYGNILQDKVAVVTGGSRGIGSSIALKLASYGADVAINYSRSADAANQVVSEIESMGRKGLAVQADVASFSDAQNMVDTVIEKLGTLDILVCNAGINMDGVIWKMTEEQWDRVIEVNLKGYFNYARAAAPFFREKEYGKIVNVSSINGLRGKFGQSNYTAAKGGIIAFTKTLARELGSKNINCNCVTPGLIHTGMVDQMDEAARDKSRAEIILGRIGEPEEVANVVAFLASDLSRHITGQAINVDGGQLM